jgi:MscS family membrane protein
MVDSIVDNISLRTKRRGEILLQVELKATSSDLKNIIEALKQKLQGFSTDDNSVILSEIRPDSYVISIEYFTGMITIASYNEMKQDINLAVLEILEKSGIGMAGKNKILGTVN